MTSSPLRAASPIGSHPVFAVMPGSYNIDPKEVLRKSPRTKLFPFTFSADVRVESRPLLEEGDQHRRGLRQAIGPPGPWVGRPKAGRWKLGCFSFFPTNLGRFGDGLMSVVGRLDSGFEPEAWFGRATSMTSRAQQRARCATGRHPQVSSVTSDLERGGGS